MTESVFRRCPLVEILTKDGETYTRRGTVRPEKTGAPPFGDETVLEYGTVFAPLFLYEGDAAELLGEKGKDAVLSANGQTWRVLSARREAGAGFAWVRAVLEKEAAK